MNWENLGAQITAGLGMHAGAPGGAMYGPANAAGMVAGAPMGGAGIDMAMMAPILEGLMSSQKDKPQMQAPSVGATGMRPTGQIVPNGLPASNPASIANRLRGA